MSKRLIISILLIITFLCSQVACEEYKGKFTVNKTNKEYLDINNQKRLHLPPTVDVANSTGQKVSIENLKDARIIKIIRNNESKITKIIILGWWD